MITMADERTYLCLQVCEGVFGSEGADKDRLIDAKSMIFETMSDLESSFVGDDIIGDKDFLLFLGHEDLPFRGVELDLIRLTHTIVSYLSGLEFHDVCKDLLPGAIVLDSRVTLIEFGDETDAGGHIEQSGIILSTDFAFGQQGKDTAIHNKGSVLFHKVKAEGGTPVLSTVEDADLRIELPEVDALSDMALENGIAVVEHLIDDIGSSALVSAFESISGILDKGGISLPIAPGSASLEQHGTPTKVIEGLPSYRHGQTLRQSINGLGEYPPKDIRLVVILEVVTEELGLVFDLVRHKCLDEVPNFVITQGHLRFHDRGEDGLRPFESGIGLSHGIVKDDPDASFATVLGDIAAE